MTDEGPREFGAWHIWAIRRAMERARAELDAQPAPKPIEPARPAPAPKQVRFGETA